MAHAVALSQRSRALSTPNPNVGAVIVKDGRVIGRGVTAAGGRPHAEALALAQAGEAARGGTVYVTLEPCAHISARGPCCADLLVEAGLKRVVMGHVDPDPRTHGEGVRRLAEAGIVTVSGVGAAACRRAMAGFFARQEKNRPLVTLKIATSLDGRIALSDGSSRWITGAPARRHAHLERAMSSAILVGRGTFDADEPRLDVRLAGLEARSPARFLLSSRCDAPFGWTCLDRPEAIADPALGDWLLIEGGAATGAAFLAAGLVDRLLIYRAPIMIGGTGRACIDDFGLGDLGRAHGLWNLVDSRMLGSDRLEMYEAAPA